MKFAALALALLLAVGSQAAVLQADAPSALDHYSTMLHVGVNRLKSSLSALDNTEYSYVKETLQQALQVVDDAVTNHKDEAIAFIQTMKETASETLGFDYASVKTELTPMFQELRIREHIRQYIEKLVPIVTEFVDQYRIATETARSTVDSRVAELKQIYEANLEDTQSKLVPIRAVVQRELGNVFSKVKEMVEGYAQEYKEQALNQYRFLSSHTRDQIEAKRLEMEKVGKEIYERLVKLQEITVREVQ